MLKIVNDLRMISVISGMELCSDLKCGQEKFGKTGFEFSDNLAWGRGCAAGAWQALDLRFAGIELFRRNSGRL